VSALLGVEGLTKRFGGVAAVDGCSLEVRLTAIFGSSGRAAVLACLRLQSQRLQTTHDTVAPCLPAPLPEILAVARMRATPGIADDDGLCSLLADHAPGPTRQLLYDSQLFVPDVHSKAAPD